jgi:hypothetical protein
LALASVAIDKTYRIAATLSHSMDGKICDDRGRTSRQKWFPQTSSPLLLDPRAGLHDTLKPADRVAHPLTGSQLFTPMRHPTCQLARGRHRQAPSPASAPTNQTIPKCLSCDRTVIERSYLQYIADTLE